MAKSVESFDDLVQETSKKYDLKIGTLSEVADDIVGLTTGNLSIDYVTGVGGLPLGRITEIYGQPSSGKTTAALQTAAELQKRIISEKLDEYILYLDFEHAMDGEYAGALGLDVEHPSFLLGQPNWLEDGAEIALKLIASGKIRLSIWDSVAEMAPKELEFGIRTNAMERARLMNSLLQRLNSLLYEQSCAGVFINHLTEAIQMGGRPGMPPQETSPGGKGLKFYASLRLTTKQVKTIKGKQYDPLTGTTTEQVVATHVKVKATKNKISPPYREAEVRVRLGQGFDNFWSASQVLTAHKKIVLGTAGYYYFDNAKVPELVHADMGISSTGRPFVHGEASLLEFADSHTDWREKVISEAVELVRSSAGSEVMESLASSSEEMPSLVGDVDPMEIS